MTYGLLPETQKTVYSQILFLLTRFGEEPVLVFFVLSGFLVGGRAIRGMLSNDIDARSYFIDRFVRILLPLIASSILVIIIDIITNVPIPFKNIIGSIFSLQGIIMKPIHNAPLWSLSYEVWFYILIGCIMVISRNNKKYVPLSFLILTICIYVFAQLNTMYLLILFIGAFSFLLPRQHIKFKKTKIIICICLLAFSFILLQSTSTSKSIVISNLYFVNREFASILLAFVTSLLVNYLIVSPPKTKIGNRIEKFSSKLSGFSYTLYLTHYPLMSLLAFWGFPKSKQLDITSIIYYILAVLISLVVAYLIYLISEKQTSSVKHLIKKKLKITASSSQ